MRSTKLLFLGLCLAASLILTQASPATAIIASSTFDTTLDGWTPSNPGSFTWVLDADINHGGCVSTQDISNHWLQAIAPSSFHGAWPSGVNAKISADFKFTGTGSVIYTVSFAISDGHTVYYSPYFFNNFINGEWKTYTVSLDPSLYSYAPSPGNWSLWGAEGGNGGYWYNNGAYITRSQAEAHTLATVLSNVIDFRIRVDWVGSPYPDTGDTSRFDNVRLTPIPSSALLLGSGLLGLGLLFFRRRAG